MIDRLGDFLELGVFFWGRSPGLRPAEDGGRGRGQRARFLFWRAQLKLVGFIPKDKSRFLQKSSLLELLRISIIVLRRYAIAVKRIVYL